MAHYTGNIASSACVCWSNYSVALTAPHHLQGVGCGHGVRPVLCLKPEVTTTSVLPAWIRASGNAGHVNSARCTL